ncbi:MFS general substrate transporter [Aulographum hederae CBS 113979]|uniref:MFS general substrate transporter n=1 Tax=Aulographum hederae CBS 113979 TaxID=1176131 RepID=A0A6G1GL37_9PEZI|nr:MFS general substrate transporter [Aulographum hederae CBS 113979]
MAPTGRANQRFASSILCIGSFLWGYNVVMLPFVDNNPGYTKYFHGRGPGVMKVIAAVFYIGACAFGSYHGPFLQRCIGYREALIWQMLIGILGVGLQVGMKKDAALPMTVCGRLFAGAGLWSVHIGVPIFLCEIAWKYERGRYISKHQTAIMVGVSAALWATLATTASTDPWIKHNGWRLLLGVQLLPMAIFCVMMLYIKEGPRNLIFRNPRLEDRAEEAMEHYREGLVSGADATEEIEDIFFVDKVYAVRKMDAALNYDSGWLDLNLQIFIKPKFIQMMWKVALLFFMAELCGASAVSQWAEKEAVGLGLRPSLAKGSAAVESLVKILFTWIAGWFMDRVGRKRTLFMGMAIMVVCLAVLGSLPSADSSGRHPHTHGPRFVAIIFIFLYDIGFALGYSTLRWVCGTEFFPLPLRATALSIASFAGIGGYMLQEHAMQLAINWAGKWWFFMYMALILSTVMIIYHQYPETNGHILEHCENFFHFWSCWKLSNNEVNEALHGGIPPQEIEMMPVQPRYLRRNIIKRQKEEERARRERRERERANAPYV